MNQPDNSISPSFPIIFPNVEYYPEDIPNRAFFRNTSKIFLKVTEEELVFTGKTIPWSEIKSASVKSFNANPYIQIIKKDGSKESFFFESKFYYRKKAPWFGASKFLTESFVKILDSKSLLSMAEFEDEIKNKSTTIVHRIWNSIFWVLPPLLLIASYLIIIAGLEAGT